MRGGNRLGKDLKRFLSLVAGGRGRGRPIRAAGASPVTGASGAEHEWACPRSSAVRTRLEVMKPPYGTQRAALFDGSIVVPPGLSR